jgi:hypothetical protein
MPIMNFLLKAQLWLGEQSLRRDMHNPNYLKFAKTHTFVTKDWTEAHSWRMNNKKQIRYVPYMQTYVALSPTAVGDLTEARAVNLINAFNNSSWETYDIFTNMFYNVSILRVDATRPEGFNCTCLNNCKFFHCCHSLGVAMIRTTMVAPVNARVHLLGRERKRGRKPQAGHAWERQGIDINSPVHHPQQNHAELAGEEQGAVVHGENLGEELEQEI